MNTFLIFKLHNCTIAQLHNCLITGTVPLISSCDHFFSKALVK